MTREEPDFEQIVHAMLDDVASDDDTIRFRSFLKQDPRRMDDFIRLLDLHASLRTSALEEEGVRKARGTPGRPAGMEPGAMRFRMRVAGPLAAAAALVVAVGVGWWWENGRRKTEDGILARVVEANAECRMLNAEGKAHALKVGDEVRQGMRIETGEGGRVKFAYVGQETTVEVGEVSGVRCQVSERGGKRLFLEKGRLAAVVAKQPDGKPFVVETPHARATVKGTRLMLLVSDGTGSATRNDAQSAISNRQSVMPFTRLDVSEGCVALTRVSDGMAVDVGKAQFAIAGKDYVLKTYPADAKYVDGAVLFQDDFEKGLDNWWFSLAGGTNRMSAGDCPYVRIEEADCAGGRVRCLALDARQTPGGRYLIANPAPSAGEGDFAVESDILIERPANVAECRLSGWTMREGYVSGWDGIKPGMPAFGRWYRGRTEFVTVPDGRGGHVVRQSGYVGSLKTTECSLLNAEGANRHILIRARGARVLLANVRIVRLVPIGESGETNPPQRVEKDLLALYLFSRHEGNVVPNLGPAGRSMDLRVKNPGLVEWTSDGVRVKGAAEIGSGEVSAVQEAWRRTGGLTAEMWFRLPKEDHPEGFDYVLGQFRVGRHDFRWTSKQAPAEAAGTVNHMVFTWSREGQDVVGRYYSIGIPVITEKYDQLGSELERCPLRYVMGPTELWDKQRLWREYEVMGLAIYGRALTPEEILRNWREVQADPSAGHGAEAPGNGGAQ